MPRMSTVMIAAAIGIGSAGAVAPGRATATVVELPFGVSLTIPGTWTSTRPEVADALQARRSRVDATGLQLDDGGALVTFWPSGPAEAIGEASVSLMVLPTQVSQQLVKGMSANEIADAERRWFRPEAEQAAAKMGWQIASWVGTTKGTVGGRLGLITRYTVARGDGPPLRKETYAVYLGRRQVVAHVFLPAESGTTVELHVREMLASLRIVPDHLE